MATIAISNLYVPGADLFSDSESYLAEVSDSDVLRINGGIVSSPACVVGAWAVSGVVVSGVVGYFSRP